MKTHSYSTSLYVFLLKKTQQPNNKKLKYCMSAAQFDEYCIFDMYVNDYL